MVVASSYPPAKHVLRDLALTVEHHEDGTGRARLPVVDAVLDDHGRVRAGMLATLVDAIGGGLAAYAAAPGWIATADLDLQLFGTLTGLSVVDATGRVLRVGRSTVVISVELASGTDRHAEPIGLATMTFAVLPRRDTNPVMPEDRVTGPQSFTSGTASGFEAPVLDSLGLRTVDAAAGVVELEPAEYVENSLGAVQGGVVACMVERAAELALSHAAGRALAPVGLQITYLALAREGPIRSAVGVLGVERGGSRWGARGVELSDAGAGRRTTVAPRRGRNSPGRPLMEVTDEGRSVARFVGVELREVGDWENGEVVGEATSPLHDHLRAPGGGMRTGALLTMCDNVGGFCAGLAALPEGWVVSTNLTLTVTPVVARGPLRLRSTVLRAGRAAIVTDVRVTDSSADEAIVADAVLTSAVLVPEGGPPQWVRPAHMQAPPPAGALPPLLEWLGVRDVAGAPAGVVELDVTDSIRNPWGIVHGGVTAALVDVAAERAAASFADAPVDGFETGDVSLHFLAPSRVGPVRATATVLGRRADGVVVLVEVRDVGRDRGAARAVATVRPRSR